MDRMVTPEILDSLPENSPAARANRRAIYRYNLLMGNFRWVASSLQRHARPLETAVELGAGDGRLGRSIARPRGLHRIGLGPVLGIDRIQRPARWPQEWPWHQGDLREWDGYEAHPVVIANFILHQLHDNELALLGERWNRHARLLVFNETLRVHRALWLARISFLLGATRATRHDAIASIRAGFRADELGSLIGLDPDRWQWWAQPTLLGAYRFVAVRRDSSTSA